MNIVKQMRLFDIQELMKMESQIQQESPRFLPVK